MKRPIQRPVRRNAGFTLIELMISMLLGMLIVAAAVTIFLSNQRVQRAAQGVGSIQESLQIGFEMLARDIRAAGVNPCDSTIPVANVINNATANWWTDWNNPVLGHAAGALAGSAADSDGLQLLISDGSVFNVQSHAGTSIVVDGSTAYAAGDPVMVCDMRQLAIFRNAAGAGATVDHASGAGNCSNSLNTVPAACNGSAPAYFYGANAQVTRLQGVRWYVADNGRGTRSLFRLINNAAAEEMVEGVSSLQLRYLQQDAGLGYVDSASISDWSRVTAVEVTLSANDDQRAGLNGQSFQRSITNIINMRGRTL